MKASLQSGSEPAKDLRGHAHWPSLEQAAVPLRVRIPLARIKMRDLSVLQAGTTMESAWPATDEVPLSAGERVLTWCEFDGAETMSVRVTRLA